MNPAIPRVVCQLRYERCGAPLRCRGMVDFDAKLLPFRRVVLIRINRASLITFIEQRLAATCSGRKLVKNKACWTPAATLTSGTSARPGSIRVARTRQTKRQK